MAATDNAVNTFTAPAGCESRRPHGSLRPAPCEPPAPGQNRPAGLRAALSRAVAPARHAAAVFLVVVAGLLAVSTAAQAQTTATFIYTSNSTESPSGAGNAFQAQSFMTGPNSAGYPIAQVRLMVNNNNTAGLSTSVTIRENDASNRPGDLVATLTYAPPLVGGNIWNFFTPPPDTSLDPNTTYWITVHEGVASNRVRFARTSGHGEHSRPDTGWSIGDGRLWRNSETDDWSSSAAPLFLGVRGPPHVSVTIEPNYPRIVAGIEDLVFTLTRMRTGQLLAELEAKVTIVQDWSWLGTSDLEHTVTFALHTATATLTLNASSFSSDPDTAGDLTATVSGNTILGDSTTVRVTVADGDEPGLVLSKASLGPSEGASESYTVALATQPSAQVTVTITGHSGTDLTLDETSLTFTTTNWATAQTVRVTAAEDDDAADDEETLTHTASGGDYASVAEDLEVTVADGDEPGLVLSKASLGPSEGASESYTVALATQPSAQVTVTITGHSGTDLTLDETSLTFTTTNWATAQTVRVTAAEDDDAADDEETLTHTASGGDYASVAEDLEVTVADGDEPGLVLSKASLGPSEGASESYTVALATQPSAQVTVTITGHSGTDLTLDETSLTFTTTNWATAQTVRVTAAEDDDAADDEETLTHTASGGDYASVAEDLEVTVADGDEPGLVLSKASLGPSEGASESYTVALATQPSAQVTVTITGHSGTDLTLDETSLTFTTTNWATAQTVRVTAAEDDDAADDEETLTHTASGGDYASVAEDLEVTVADGDEPGLVLSKASLGPSEGASESYTVALATQPSAQVTVTITGHSGTDLTLDETSLTFTTTNWATAQTVRVTAAEDDDAADDEETLTHTASGGDYASVAEDLEVTVADGDEPGLVPEACVLGGDVWCATLTVKNLGSGNRGCANSQSDNECSNTSHLTEDEFTHDMTDYTVSSVQVRSNGQLQFWFSPDLTTPTGSLVLVVGSERFPLARAHAINNDNRRWNSSGLSWLTGDTVELRLVEESPPLASAAPSPPLAPAAPEVNGVDNSETSLKVTWSAPDNAGRPPITHYDLRYRTSRTGTGGWLDGPQDQTGTNATIMGLTAGRQYDVQVRASNADGDGPWSPSGQGMPGVVETVETHTKGTPRLVDNDGNPTTGGGRLEVFFRGEWGTVCDDRFNRPFFDYSSGNTEEKVPNIAADLACQWMGYEDGGEIVSPESLNMDPVPAPEYAEKTPIWLDDVRCAAGSTHWRDHEPTALHHCYHAGVSLHNCDHSEDVYLQCTGTLNQESATQEEEAAPLTASFEDLPATHDGETPFTFRLVLSEDIANGDVDVRDSAFEVTGGSVTGASRVDGRSDLWEISVTPDGTGDIGIVLAANRECGTAGALCTADGRMLTTAWLGSVAAQPGTGTATTSADEEGAAPLTARFAAMPAEHDGASKFRFRLVFSDEIFEGTEPFDKNKAVRNALDITGGAAKGSRRVDKTEFDEYWIDVRPSGNGPVTISLSPASSCSTSSVTCTPDGRKLSAAIGARVEGPPGLSVADAEVQEGPGAALAFAVTLDRSTSAAVQVDYATRDGSAQAGSDYTASSGTLNFAPGETAKTVTVAVLDDSHDEGSETLTLVLSNPSGAYLADGEATGTIENSDLMPQAWLSRFGRTVAEQVLDAVEERIRSAPQAGVQVTVAGQRIGAAQAPSDEEAREAQARLESFSTWLAGEAEARESRTGSRAVASHELLTGSSFALTTGAEGAGGGMGSLWGRGMLMRIEGREGELSLSGEVTGTLLGADWTKEGWTAGLMLSHAQGEGSYRGVGRGRVSSTVTGLYPYGRLMVADQVTIWGTAGYGAGRLTMTPEDDQTYEADMDLTMAAAGLRGTVVEAPPEGGPELAVKTHAMAVRTSSKAVIGSAGGRLAAATADVTRLRLGLEGTWQGLKTGTGTLTPRLEIGVRHDGGDAETGFGLDLGGGLAWSDPETGIRAEMNGRGLLTHEADGFRQRGIAGSLGWDPTPGSNRGPRLALTQTMGLSARGGADALLGRTTLEGLAANDDGDELQRRRLELKLGYGFPAFGDRFTSTPEVGFGMSEGHRDYSLVWRLVRDRRRGDIGSLEFSLEARRRESANDDAELEHGVGFRMTARY